MKNFIILLLYFSLPFVGCKNNPPKKEIDEKPITKNQRPQIKKAPKNTPLPSLEEGIDYWTANNCKRTIPTSTILKEYQFNGYTFNLNPQQGYGKETMFLENGYKLDVTSKGCNSIVNTYSYFFTANDLDVSDEMAVSKKVLELIEMTAKMSKAEFNIKSRLNPLKVMVEQIGPFTIGNELILSEKNGMQKFSMERLEFKESKNKVFLSYYFSYNL
ncbi:MAG: hypothetical protein P8M17_01090 [Saprospiraceae bacterium]|nr:hypothetical protein [Saprospiraceae bacterium]MDG2417555.1 hypothetical protein [Saprospiraceae bacterium]